MAQQPDIKQQNQAFLQEMERQRLNKICTRIIDLRGKVSGECQAYQFGDRTHYLDDRGYLLAKQLLARFNGHYTVGVYEALIKAIKLLNQHEERSPQTHTRPDFLKLDRSLDRTEQRVLFSTPVRLRLDDVLYHGHTIDISPSAMRISLKRSYSLQVGNQLSVELVDWYEQQGLAFLQQLPFKIIKMDQTENKTILVLSLLPSADVIVTEWLDNWVNHCAKHKSIDIDDQIHNQLINCYLNLWLKKFGSPLLWLADNACHDRLLFNHCSAAAQAQLDKLSSITSHSVLELLSTGLINQQHRDLLIVLANEQCWMAPMDQQSVVNRLLNWHQQHADSHVLLLKSHPLSIDTSHYTEQLSQISQVDDSVASTFKQQLGQISSCSHLYDITLLCRGLPAPITVTEAQIAAFKVDPTGSNQPLPQPKTLTQQITRGNNRFYIHTPITAHIDGQALQLETLDVSADGLALQVAEPVTIKLNQRVSIDFTRWQTMTKKVNLSQIPYQVKNKIGWGGEVRLGLQRIKANCPENLNDFFDDVIAKNQASLRVNHIDIIDAAESMVFINALKPTLTTIPVFLGMNASGQRSIEMIGDTLANQASHLPETFWEALTSLLISLTDQFKALSSHNLNYGYAHIYAYLDQRDQWQLTLEPNFSSEQHKAIFIQRGLAAKAFLVYHALLIPLSSLALAEDPDLAASFMRWHSQRAHRVKQIRQQLNALFGIIELHDVSDFIRACYKPHT